LSTAKAYAEFANPWYTFWHMDKEIKTTQKILILGAGFGGVKAALELCKNPNFEVTLLSDQDNFRYYPTIFNIALGKSHLGASIPLSEIFEGKKVQIVKATAETLDRQAKNVKTTDGNIYLYDHLIIALGVVTNYFGIEGLDKFSYGIKNIEDAQELRDHLHKQLVDDKKPDVNYVIIGGGPTGVELAGSLPGYMRHIMKKHGITDTNLHIDLVEAAPRLVPRMTEPYSRAVAKRLSKLGVSLYLNETVKAETADNLQMNNHNLESHTVVWTAGVTNHPFLKANNFALNDKGKAKVDEHLQNEPNIYVIGDNADTPYSGMAQTALYDGQFISEHMSLQAAGKNLVAYKPKKPVYVIPAGPKWAAVMWGQLHLYGWAGWVLREAADLKGFSDYEPWWKASKHWLAQENDEETCSVCTAAKV
jgi:NADH dehydrogenase